MVIFCAIVHSLKIRNSLSLFKKSFPISCYCCTFLHRYLPEESWTCTNPCCVMYSTVNLSLYRMLSRPFWRTVRCCGFSGTAYWIVLFSWHFYCTVLSVKACCWPILFVDRGRSKSHISLKFQWYVSFLSTYQYIDTVNLPWFYSNSVEIDLD